eukprot:Skav221425  [mRNA]  locus=scaffold2260:45593:45880:- [translate_table: standard]
MHFLFSRIPEGGDQFHPEDRSPSSDASVEEKRQGAKEAKRLSVDKPDERLTLFGHEVGFAFIVSRVRHYLEEEAMIHKPDQFFQSKNVDMKQLII